MLKINACYGIQGASYSERYVPDGYFDEMDFNKFLEEVSKIKDVTGHFVYYPGHPLIDNPEKLKRKLADYNTVVSDIGAVTWPDRKFKYGTLTSKDKKIRKETIDIVKHTMDLAVELNAHSVLLWPAHDGMDYAFQADFAGAWDYLIGSLEEIGEYNPKVKVAVEYKQKDPRAKCYIEDIGKLMYVIKSLNADNIGGALDLGHAFLAGERPAETLEILSREAKLYQIHLNDNYRDADPDLLFGTINFWDSLEFFYWLAKTGYDGWIHTDFVSPRDDRMKIFRLVVKTIREFEEMAAKLMEHSEVIEKNLKDHNFVDNIELVKKVIFH